MLGSIGDPRTGADVDEALVTCFHAPHSYTGENVAEASVHGSPVIVSQLLEVLCREGARLAEPGEFTLRAFLHGRMDLAQAEGVRDVIEANTRYQLQVASRQRAGELSEQLQPIKRHWTDVIVSLEAAVEFVEEDLAIESRALLAAKLDETAGELAKWIGTFRRGRIVRDGFSLAIAGRPNAGKSSLFNALLAEERSIVTEIPGTTRDAVSEFASIGGIPVRLIDTAGLREGADRVERIGVDRSLRVMADADAIVLVIDTSRPCTEEDDLLRARLCEFSCVVAFNKSDLPDVWTASQKASLRRGLAMCGGLRVDRQRHRSAAAGDSETSLRGRNQRTRRAAGHKSAALPMPGGGASGFVQSGGSASRRPLGGVCACGPACRIKKTRGDYR